MSKLQKLRKKQNMSQSQLAEKAHLSTRMLQHYEQGVKDINNVRLNTLLKLCIALNCEIKDIIDSQENLDLLDQYEKRH